MALSLFVTDIDNTLFDWVGYYVRAFSALLHTVEGIVSTPFAELAEDAKAIFAAHGSIEYPFVVQELAAVNAHFGDDLDGLLRDAVRPARDAFNREAVKFLKPYAGVVEVLAAIRAQHPGVPVVALTDAPRYVAMWKLNKLGLLPYFDAVYGLPDPRLPTSVKHNRVKVDPEILLKHLQQTNFEFPGRIRILPDDYEKPGTKGLKTVLMDYDMDEDTAHRAQVAWVGDNRRKDVSLGKRLGVRTAWAAYGQPEPELLERLAQFSPMVNIHKNAAIADGEADGVVPDVTLKTFADILPFLKF